MANYVNLAHSFGVPSATEIKQIAERLRIARMAINPENQTEYARLAGLRQNRYHQYESGERPLTLDAALKLCRTYGLTLDWLFRGDNGYIPHALLERIRRAS